MSALLFALICFAAAGSGLAVAYLLNRLAEHVAAHVERDRSAGVAKSWSGCIVRSKSE